MEQQKKEQQQERAQQPGPVELTPEQTQAVSGAGRPLSVPATTATLGIRG
jgi:hypothetical protein